MLSEGDGYGWPPRQLFEYEQTLEKPPDSLNRELLNACCNGDLHSLHACIEQLGQYNHSAADSTTQSLLPEAAKNGHADILRYLFDTLPMCQRPLPWQHYFGQFCLPLNYDKGGLHGDDQMGQGVGDILVHALEGTNPPAIIKVLIDYGLSPDHDLKKRTSLLSEAVKRKKDDVVRLLLEHGANPGRHRPNSALTMAVKNDDAEMVSLLVKYGACIEESDAFACAVAYRRIRAAEVLLELGADINNIFTTINRNGVHSQVRAGTPLYRAIKAPEDQPEATCSLEDVIRFLLVNGARTDIAGIGRKTPFQVARQKKRKGALKVFKEFGITK